MNFETCLIEKKAKAVMPNKIRAASLIISSTQAIETAKIIPLTENSAKTILRELYEGLREFCEALGYVRGYKFSDHESITYFLEAELKNQSASKKFDRYRRLRNGINYYGESVDIETIKGATEEIPKLIKELEKYSKG